MRSHTRRHRHLVSLAGTRMIVNLVETFYSCEHSRYISTRSIDPGSYSLQAQTRFSVLNKAREMKCTGNTNARKEMKVRNGGLITKYIQVATNSVFAFNLAPRFGPLGDYHTAAWQHVFVDTAGMNFSS
jgi:hypothetical protein